MTLLGHKHAFFLGQRSLDVHSLAEPKSKQGHGQLVFPRPLREALGFATKLNEPLPGLVGSVPGVRLCSESLFYRPSVSEAPCEVAGVKPEFFGPRADVLRSSAKLNVHIAGNVGLLLFYRAPSAVSRLVPFPAIDAVNGGADRSLPHIEEEVFKGLSPSVANSYATSAVGRKFRACRSIAPGKHAVVSNVSGALSAFGSVPMLRAASFNAAQLTTVFGESFGNTILLGEKLFAAVKAFGRRCLLAHHSLPIACNELIVTYKARVAGFSVELPGLKKRRLKEMELCLSVS